jgi:hypothetical protein
MSDEKRRSDRLMLTIPLTVEGTDARGHTFQDEARTLTLNRHGARIRTSRPLRVGQTLRLTNRLVQREAEFRVVGPLTPITERGGEWGIEYQNLKDDIWGIQFPPSTHDGGPGSKALIECRQCHTVALLPLSLVEVDVLETAGIISRTCAQCERETPWGYAEKQVVMGGTAREASMMKEAHAAARGIEQRQHRRVSLQLPIRIRDFYGGSEITRTENVSKGGFCFVSEINHHIGGAILVICPYDPAGPSIEIRARIVRQREVEGTRRKVYGVRYAK